MASPILHIKDGYYFDVPKVLWPSGRESINDFPQWWVKLDDQYQMWEGGLLYDSLPKAVRKLEKDPAVLPPKAELLAEYGEWKHAGHHHENVGKPFERYLAESDSTLAVGLRKSLGFVGDGSVDEWKAELKSTREDVASYSKFENSHPVQWSPKKIEQYNKHLSGKIIIPQPFGAIKNLHEPASGFCLSKYMVLEVVVAVLITFVFVKLASKISGGGRPIGKFTNFFESLLVFMRDEVARPAIGRHDADRFLPLLWTIFFFVLSCNLLGMLPWAGAPTSAFAVTLSLAVVTLLTGMISGSLKFGPLGYWKNQVPSMELPKVMAVVLIPMIFAIEIVGLFIKHGVLGVRLLANMVAGHVVLLGIMGIAFSVEGAVGDIWYLTAPVSVISATLFSCLELFVAFLQAYVFTFLSSLFIGAAIHHH